MATDWLKQLALKNKRLHERDPLPLLMLIRNARWGDQWDLLHNWGTEMAMANYLLPGQWGTSLVYIIFSGVTELMEDGLYNVKPVQII